MKSCTNFLLFDENSIYYECGYSNDNSIYIQIGSEKFFLTDSRYETEAKLSLKKGIELIIDKDISKKVNKLLKKIKPKKITIDPSEINLSQYNIIFKDLDVKIKEISSFSHLKRILKTNSEIELIKKASLLAKNGFKKFENYLFDKGFNKDEFFLSYKLKEYISSKDRFDLSFSPIVAINKNAALPHAKYTDTKFKQNDLILIDAGIKYKRYCSDRTVTIGKKSKDFSQREQKFKDKFIQKVYDSVLKAQELAIKKAKAGVRANEIDKVAREYLDKKGLAKYFIHSTGHGVGLDIHELPIISQRSKTIIEDNMVFTIEPGVYIPNYFGVRIEDMVVIKNGKSEIL